MYRLTNLLLEKSHEGTIIAPFFYFVAMERAKKLYKIMTVANICDRILVEEKCRLIPQSINGSIHPEIVVTAGTPQQKP